jgi:hypothetical protein
MLFFIHCSALVLLCFLFGFLCFKVSWHAYDDVSVCPDLYYSFIKNEWWSWTLWGTGMSKQANFHTCLFYSVFLVRKSYFSRLWIWPLCHTIFVHRWSCNMWLLVVRVWFVDLSMTCGAGRTIWFLGCRAALASRLLRLLLSFDYHNPFLLFLKL